MKKRKALNFEGNKFFAKKSKETVYSGMWKHLPKTIEGLSPKKRYKEKYPAGLTHMRDMSTCDRPVAYAIRTLVHKASGGDILPYIRLLFPEAHPCDTTEIKDVMESPKKNMITKRKNFIGLSPKRKRVRTATQKLKKI